MSSLHTAGFLYGSATRPSPNRELGVLLLTARQRESDRIKGLALGADDCLAKPFSPPELVLRARAILRRLGAPARARGGRVSAGPVVLDNTAHRVRVDGVDVDLTATEFKLLRALLEREGRVQTRAELLETVWSAPPDVAPGYARGSETRRGYETTSCSPE